MHLATLPDGLLHNPRLIFFISLQCNLEGVRDGYPAIKSAKEWDPCKYTFLIMQTVSCRSNARRKSRDPRFSHSNDRILPGDDCEARWCEVLRGVM